MAQFLAPLSVILGLLQEALGIQGFPNSSIPQAVSLHFMYYNFARIHQSLWVTPAMEAGITDHLWTLQDVAKLVD